MKSLSLSTPHLIVMVGIPGAGKTFFARQFADMFHAPLLSNDMFTNAAPDLDADTNQKLTIALTTDLLPEILKTGKTVLLDGTGSMRNERAELQKVAKKAGYNTLLVWLQTDTATAKIRCVKPHKGSEKRAMRAEEFDAIARKFSPPHPTEKYIVLSGKHTYASQAKMLLRKLSEPRSTSQPTQNPTNTPAIQPPKRPTGNRISIS